MHVKIKHLDIFEPRVKETTVESQPIDYVFTHVDLNQLTTLPLYVTSQLDTKCVSLGGGKFPFAYKN